MKHEQNRSIALGCWNRHSVCLQRREINYCSVFRHTKICNLIQLMFLRARQFSNTSVSSGPGARLKHTAGEETHFLSGECARVSFPCHSLWPQTTRPQRWRDEYQGCTLWSIQSPQHLSPFMSFNTITNALREAWEQEGAVLPTLNSETLITHEKTHS